MTTAIRLTTPSRLHFGLLALGPQTPRQYGGVGLMIETPGLELTAQPAERWGADGPLAARAVSVAQGVAAQFAQDHNGPPLSPIHLHVHRAPPEHVGLGTGTQLSLAVARALVVLAGQPDPDVATLARLTGRGLRSGIGLHGFVHGGLIVDGGRRHDEGIPPRLVHLDFPPDWHVLVIVPNLPPGLHGPDEVEAFQQLAPMSDAVSDRLCRLVLLGLLPAVVERDLAAFGAALTAIQFHVGRSFALSQSGSFVRPELEPLVAAMRAEGLHGVGQSSWGPTLYGFAPLDAAPRERVLTRLRDRFPDRITPDTAFWTRASAQGASIHCNIYKST